MPVIVTAPGTVQTINNVTVKPQIDGIVKEINFNEGQVVKVGDKLVQIDPAPFQQAYDKAKAELAKDTATRDFYRVQAERYKMLVASGAASQQDYDSQNTQYKQYSATVDADKAALETASINLGYTKITARLTGKTGPKLVNIGDTVKTNDTQIVSINQILPIYVQFSIAEKYFTKLRELHFAKKTIYADAALQSDATITRRGEVTFGNNAVDTATGMFMLRATYPNKDVVFYPGQFVNVVLTLSTQENAVVVPVTALQSNQDGSSVFVVRPDHTVALKKVTVDRTIGDEAVIASGSRATRQS